MNKDTQSNALADPAETLSADSFVPWRELLTSRYTPALALVCLAVWLHAADSLIVATMLPSIVADVGGTRLVSWSVSLYQIASVVAGAAAALLTMRYGLRLPMSFAALLFALGCAMSALAPSMPLILVGRALQGLAGGGLVAMSFVAVGVIFPRRYTARAMAAVSTFWGISAFLGPLIGGFFVEFATWRWGFAFFALQAMGLAVWIAMRKADAPPKLESQSARGFPLRRLGLLCLAVLLVSYASVEVRLLQTSALVGLGVACLALFLWLDSRADHDRLLPKAPLDLRQPTGAALVMILCLTAATVAMTTFGPLLVTAIHQTSAVTAGYIVACGSIGWSVMAVTVSGTPERLDRLIIALGVGLIVVSVAGLAYAVPHGPVWLIAAFAMLDGGGFGMAWTFILRRTTALASPGEMQRVAGAIPTIQRLGNALGAALLGIVANVTGITRIEGAAEAPSAASPVATWVFGASLPLAVLGLVAMVALVRPQGAEVKGMARA